MHLALIVGRLADAGRDLELLSQPADGFAELLGTRRVIFGDVRVLGKAGPACVAAEASPQGRQSNAVERCLDLVRPSVGPKRCLLGREDQEEQVDLRSWRLTG